jgi:DNA-binding HxlR family transcriptional regulator
MSDEGITQIAAGLAGRIRLLVTALDRLDRLESGSGNWQASFVDAELAEATTAMTLRALQTGSDHINFMILTALAATDSQAIGSLIETTGIGRFVLSERLNDLVQVGLATRLIDTDHVQITAAGASLVQLINEIRAEVSNQYLARQVMAE